MRLPSNALVVLIGPAASGKSSWAAAHFQPGQVLSSDSLRAIVGEGEHDQRASKDAFDLLDLALERRLRRGLLTVVDSLGLDAKRRRHYRAAAAGAGVPCIAVLFDIDAAECRRRNRLRARPVPSAILTSMLRTWAQLRNQLGDEEFTSVHPADEPVEICPPDMVDAPAAARRQQETPMHLEFGLQLPRFTWPGGPTELATDLAGVARAAEDAGFSSVWVMDHFLQIPVVGRHWEDMLDSYTTLSFLAAHTTEVTLGALVTGVTYRNIAHLAKIVATLDVLSGGRAVCGLGAAWFEREHRAYGWEFPPIGERYAMLEDALELLPLMWGKGAPAFKGRTIEVAETVCYPRPLQEHVPILVGGSGERRTLRLVAQYADACNLFGDAATVRHKVAVLHAHCADVGRNPDDVTVTHLSRAEAPSTDEMIGRYRQLAEAGVQTAIVSFSELDTTASIERFSPVVAAFAPHSPSS